MKSDVGVNSGKSHPEVNSSLWAHAPKLVCASKTQWRDRHRVDIAIPKGRDRKEKYRVVSQLSLKPKGGSFIKTYSLRMILLGLVLCLPDVLRLLSTQLFWDGVMSLWLSQAAILLVLLSPTGVMQEAVLQIAPVSSLQWPCSLKSRGRQHHPQFLALWDSTADTTKVCCLCPLEGQPVPHKGLLEPHPEQWRGASPLCR